MASRNRAELERIRETILLEGKGFGPLELWEYVKNNKDKVSDKILNRFEFDKNEAWEKHNIELARHLIKEQRLVITPPPKIKVGKPGIPLMKIESTRFYVSVPSKRGNGGSYERIDEVMKNNRKRKELLESALKDLDIFQNKHDILVDISSSSTHITFLRNSILTAIKESEKLEESYELAAV